MKTNIGYYLGLVITSPGKRDFCVKKIAGLLCAQNFVCFEELVLLGYACTTKEVRDVARDATIAAGMEKLRLARSRIIELGVLHGQWNVREVANEAYLALGSTKPNEATLIERLQQEPYDQKWYGALELLCQLVPRGKEAIPHFFDIMKMQYPPYKSKNKVKEALARFQIKATQPYALAMLRSNDPKHVLLALDLFKGQYLVPDSTLVTQIRKLYDERSHGHLWEQCKVVLLKYHKL